jgi:hypothetical protein
MTIYARQASNPRSLARESGSPLLDRETSLGPDLALPASHSRRDSFLLPWMVGELHIQLQRRIADPLLRLVMGTWILEAIFLVLHFRALYFFLVSS